MITIENDLVLRKMSRADVEANLSSLLRMRNDVDGTLASLSRPFGQSEDDVRTWVEAKNQDKTTVFLGCFIGPQLVGTISCTEESRLDGVGEIGIFFDLEARYKGTARRFLLPFLDFLRDAHEYRKFLARVLDTNTASKRLFESTGFRLAGTLRDHWRVKGRFVDLHIYERMARDAEAGLSGS